MKDLHPLVTFLALGLFLGFLQLASLYLRSQDSNPSPQSIGKIENSQGARTFIGRILKVNGRFVLEDSASKDTYLLDNQEKAKLFGGRKVKVTGRLDAPNRTIHVL